MINPFQAPTICVYLYILEQCPKSALHSIPGIPGPQEAVIIWSPSVDVGLAQPMQSPRALVNQCLSWPRKAVRTRERRRPKCEFGVRQFLPSWRYCGVRRVGLVPQENLLTKLGMPHAKSRIRKGCIQLRAAEWLQADFSYGVYVNNGKQLPSD